MRRRTRALVLAAAAGLALSACGRGTPVTLAQLAAWQEAYAGKHVETEGVVREERDPDGTSYFVLSDRRGRRVGLEPSARASPYAGELVRVRGRFEIEPGFGRVIRIASIGRPAAPP